MIFNHTIDLWLSSNLDETLYRTNEARALQNKYQDKDVFSKDDFLSWATDKGFLACDTKANINLDKITYPEVKKIYPDWFKKVLYQALKSNELVTGNIDDQYWQWNTGNKLLLGHLAHFAKLLADNFKSVVRNQKNITAYIYYTGTEFNKVSTIPPTTITNKFKEIIYTLQDKK